MLNPSGSIHLELSDVCYYIARARDTEIMVTDTDRIAATGSTLVCDQRARQAQPASMPMGQENFLNSNEELSQQLSSENMVTTCPVIITADESIHDGVTVNELSQIEQV